MSKSNQYVGLDVSLKDTSICVIDDAGTACGSQARCSNQTRCCDA